MRSVSRAPMPLLGSSSSMTLGLATMARAICTNCRWAQTRSTPSRSASFSSPTAARLSRARSSMACSRRDFLPGRRKKVSQ